MAVLTVFLNIFLSALCFQSTFTVVGMVRDQAGRLVTGVRLSVIDENFQPIRTIFIDTTGRYVIRGLGQGRFTFRVETTGTNYEEQSQQIELQSLRQLGGTETFPLDFVLKLKGNAPIAAGGAVFTQDIPDGARKEFERGINQLKSKKSDQAISSFKKALEIFPDFYYALEALGFEYVRNAQYESALPILTRALEINKRSFKCMYGIGVIQLKANHFVEAIEYLEKAAQIEPSSANAQMMLGLAYGNTGNFNKSVEAFNKAIRLGGVDAAEAHFYLAALHNKLERYAEARHEMERYLKEAKNLKDPAQIKAMIEKLKEKEVASAAAPAPAPSKKASEREATPASQSEPLETEPAPVSEAAAPAPVRKLSSLVTPVPLSEEMEETLRQCALNGGEMSKKLLDFTYYLKKTRRTLNQTGKSSASEQIEYEAYPVNGEHVLIELSRNGIASRKIAEARNQAAKELVQAEKTKQKNGSTGPASAEARGDYFSAGVFGMQSGIPSHVSINPSMFLRSCEFFSPRLETISGRPAVTFSFRPRFLELPRHFAYINKLVGTVWIDQAEQVIVRLEGWPDAEGTFDFAQSIAPREEASLIYQQQRIADQIWFPKLIRMNAEGRADLFGGLNWDVVFEFTRYQQFSTNSTEKIGASAGEKP